MQVQEIHKPNFQWIDLADPSVAELEKLAQTFQLDASTIHACMEPEHLPKYELWGETAFIILRAYDAEPSKKQDSIQKLTHKVALFISNQFLITIHRRDHAYIQEIFDRVKSEPDSKTQVPHLIANEIMFRVAKSYEFGLNASYKVFDAFEQDVFNKNKKAKLIQGYIAKRRINIMRRMLSLMKDPIAELMITAPAKNRSHCKRTKEYIDKMAYQADVLHENLVSLVSLQVAIASQHTGEASHRTNEVMRVLTVVSIFFMPLNFLTGLYGMNFVVMPGLQAAAGFWWMVGLMVLLTLFVFMSFRRRGWLHREKETP